MADFASAAAGRSEPFAHLGGILSTLLVGTRLPPLGLGRAEVQAVACTDGGSVTLKRANGDHNLLEQLVVACKGRRSGHILLSWTQQQLSVELR
jgi:hypothetical protein